MGTINKDLGPVTAYAYAKEGGYTGTATQFKKDLVDSANIVNTIDEMISDKADLVNGKVPSSQLPSYVDDVIEGYYKQTDGKFYEESTYETEITGEAGKIYVDLTTDNSYRWSGSAFVKINDVDVTTKADKVTNATNGNLAGLDANGNLTDSGKKASDFLTQHQTIKQDGVTGATVNRFAVCETEGNVRNKVVSSIQAGSLSLERGARISVYFNEPNTALNPRLNINNSGNYAIYYKGRQIQNAPDIYMLAGQCDFIYTYESYELVGSVNANIPPGGTTGQVLQKTSDEDYAFEWRESSGGIDMVDGGIYEEISIYALKFSSDSDFTLSAPKKWNGILEYSIDSGDTWTEWDGSQLSGTVSQSIHLRGTGNTVIIGDDYNPWTFTGKYCTGNIENLLDYQIVANGEHPVMSNYCYSSMFSSCTSLTSAPELPATTLANDCYAKMFQGCTSLITAPELPATTLVSYCYYSMFRGCTSLTQAPKLPATTLAIICYNNMFYGCTSLITAPELPATTLAESCYSEMFYGCTSLTQAPELPATTLVNDCYSSMFYSCTSLTSAPELPATTLVSYCYYSMFRGCTSLTQAPKLPATTLATHCCNNMFYGCTSLITAPELPATTLAEYCYSEMFYGCTSLTQAPQLPATTLVKNCYSEMFYGCTSLTQAPELPATTLAYYCYGSMFNNCTSLTTVPELPATTLANNCYGSMFRNCTSLTTAPELPAITLAEYCYSYMFAGCTSFKLSTTQTGEYQYTYRIPTTGTGTNASSALTNMFTNTGGTFKGTPTINTTYYLATPTVQQILKYALKFSSDNNFTLSAPKTWNGTLEYTVDNGKNWTTWDGSQLSGTDTQPIYLRGTGNTVITGAIPNGASDNRWTFTGKYCTGNIENLLDYKTVVNGGHPTMGDLCFSCMFRGCSSIVTPPELPATVLSQYCYNYMFADCIRLTVTPKLPATTLANECYSQMFFACTSLTTLPELPATTLHDKCYRQMFRNCSLIKLSKTQTEEYQYAYRIPTTGDGTTATDAMYYMFSGTGGTFIGTAYINTTYYTTNQPV